MMGNKKITFDKQSNIYVDGEEYKGTSGLWHMIMMKKTNWDNSKDLDSYAKLVEKRNAKTNPKHLNILDHIPGTNGKRYFHYFHLSITVNVLLFIFYLGVLLDEYQAGNKKATGNEIVPIINELGKRKAISRNE